ncbi:MAG: hypothetical protein QNL91_15495 [Candidatus Krumholzibacteria bacterium]|nr:hypothetical protein [Candidatus Krumholzibacteria bacterium]
MKIKNLLAISLLVVVVAATLLPTSAEAIPAFARTHKLSCTTCHAPFPRLKDFGAEFAANGFTIPEQEKERDFISAGDDLLKLNKTFPLAARFDAYAVFDSDTEITSDLQAPWALKLLSGGTLAKNVGYYFYFFMDERGEVAGVEDAYIHFNNIGGKQFDIMVGQFQTSDPLMKRELRLTYDDYQVYRKKIGDSSTDLTYDRGIMVTYDFESTGTGLVGMVVNGNGKPDAGDNRKYDNDKYKNYGFRVIQDVVDPLTVGYFFYAGKEMGTTGFANEVAFHGPDFTLGNGTLDLTFQYLFRKDTDPLFTGVDVDVETSGLVAELVISPYQDRSRNYFTLLYNQINSDWDTEDYETLTVGATHLMARNIRGTLEYTRNLDTDTNRGVIGLVTAF